jgi:flavin reductase (DIM6/NTAB) family NADH-FMN oxidoreductase RutF
MQRVAKDPWEFSARPLAMWEKDWFLLSAGDFAQKKFNSMVVSWGATGVMWGRPFAMCVVRPQRHTREFVEQYDTFTLCSFPQELRKVLDVLGTKSGRDIDKINNSGLTPMAGTSVAAPIYDEAILAIECRKIYSDDFKPKHFIADYIKGMYKKDFHRMYFGEIVAIGAAENYGSKL